MPLKISHGVSVRDSTTTLSLSSVLSSLSATSLSHHLAVLRRDINAYYVDHLLTEPTSLIRSSATDSSQTLSFLPPTSVTENLSARLKNLVAVLDFLNAHLFAAFPPSHVANFKKTLCKPVTTALLQQFLMVLLPSSLAALPPYLHLVTQAKEFEEKYVVGMLGQDPRDHEIKTWADAVSSHYERKRRAQILEDARQMILRQDDGMQIRVEVDLLNLPPNPPPNSAPVTQSSGSSSDGVADVSDDAWGLEGEESGDSDDVVSTAEEEDAWGFDDAPTEAELVEPGISTESTPLRDTVAEPELVTADSAWGWDDNGEDGEEANTPATTSPQASSSDNGADWDDDPWGESSNPSPPPSVPATPASKPAARLEKLAGKAKAKATPPHSPPPVTNPPTATTRRPPPASKRQSELVGTNNATLPNKKKEEPPKSVPQAETFAISVRTRQLADTVDGILHEAREFASTAIFDSNMSTGQQETRGSVILKTAPAVLDLFRALYPVKFSQLTEPKSIVFANDCIYAHGRVLGAARQCTVDTKDRLLETAGALEATGKKWFEQSVVGYLLGICRDSMNDVSQEIQQDLVAESLKKAEGFVGTAEQEHYDECEAAIMDVLSQVRRVARQWMVSNLVPLRVTGR